MVTKRDLEVAIAAYGLGRILPAGSTRAAVRAVIPQFVKAGKVIAPTVGRTAATLAAANPVRTGLGLGLAATQTPSGQALLDAAAERGRMDRIALEQAIDERIFGAMKTIESPIVQSAAKSTARRKVSKYSKAVKAGMKAVKASKFIGKKGTVNNAKKAFSTVNKVASAVNKGKKVSAKGVTGVIKRAVGKIL